MSPPRDRFEELGQSMLHAGFGLFFVSLVLLISYSFAGDLPQLVAAWGERLPALSLLVTLTGPVLLAQWAASCFLLVGALTFLKGDPRGHATLVRLVWLAGLWVIGALVMGLALIVPPGMSALRAMLVTGRLDENLILLAAGCLVVVLVLTAVLWDWSGRLVDLARQLTAPEILARLKPVGGRASPPPPPNPFDSAFPGPTETPEPPRRKPERSGDVEDFF